MKDADQGADKVIWIGIRAKISVVDRALHQGEKCTLDRAACAFHEAYGTTRNGFHHGKNQLFGGHVVDEEEHPRSKGFQWGHRGGETSSGVSQLVDFAAVYRFDEGVAGGEVTVQRSRTNVRTTGNVVERGVRSMLSEGKPGHLKDARAVPLRICPGLAG